MLIYIDTNNVMTFFLHFYKTFQSLMSIKKNIHNAISDKITVMVCTFKCIHFNLSLRYFAFHYQLLEFQIQANSTLLIGQVELKSQLKLITVLF